MGALRSKLWNFLGDAGYKLYIQDDVHYRFPFRPLDIIPNRGSNWLLRQIRRDAGVAETNSK